MWTFGDLCFEGLPQVLALIHTLGWGKKQDSEKLCSDTHISRGCLEEVASTKSTARAQQVSSPTGWPGLFSPLHTSTRLCTQPGLSRRRSSQRDGVQFPRRWTNLNIWFCYGSHGLFTKEIKAYLFLHKTDTESCSCMSAEHGWALWPSHSLWPHQNFNTPHHPFWENSLLATRPAFPIN